MKNKITIIIVMLCILCLTTAFVSCDGKGDTTPSGNTGSGDNGTIIIDENNQPPKFDGDDDIDYSKAVIIEGTTLTGLTEYGKTLSRIVIPDGVTSIGDGAFLDLPSDSIEIGDGSLGSSNKPAGNRNLISVEIPYSVTEIGELAFGYCYSLSYINIPNSIKSISNGAFAYCYSLTSIDLTSDITSVIAPFYGCYSLVIKYSNLELPNDWKGINILDDSFERIPIVYNYISNDIADDGYIYAVADNGVQYALKDGIAKVSGHSYISGDITIASNVSYKGKLYQVTEMNTYALYCATDINSIEIPSSVAFIGASALVCHSSSLTIYCEAESQPREWNSDWNPHNRPVVWGYKK
ncbi:MAG: leucine-rich repeat domain-containing protein [Clostridia bacterium]|nr:leucine-rich repeat domain-containing protein [Clostridia bacterium]